MTVVVLFIYVTILLARLVCHMDKTGGRQRCVTVLDFVKQRVGVAYERRCDVHLADCSMRTLALIDLC